MKVAINYNYNYKLTLLKYAVFNVNIVLCARQIKITHLYSKGYQYSQTSERNREELITKSGINIFF